MGVYAVVAGAVVGAVGSVMSGNAAKSAANDQANEVTIQARQRAKNIRYMAKQTLGSARAGYAASGVDVNSGSPLVAADTISFNSEVDALNAIASGAATARSLRRSGSAAQTAGYLQAGSSILGAFAGARSAVGTTGGTVTQANGSSSYLRGGR